MQLVLLGLLDQVLGQAVVVAHLERPILVLLEPVRHHAQLHDSCQWYSLLGGARAFCRDLHVLVIDIGPLLLWYAPLIDVALVKRLWNIEFAGNSSINIDST